MSSIYKEPTEETEYNGEESLGSAESLIPFPILPVSGLYEVPTIFLPPHPLPIPLPIPIGPGPQVEQEADEGVDAAIFPFTRESLRLDVDRSFAQNAASGTIMVGVRRFHWLARLTRLAALTWTGAIFYRDGDATLLPHTAVKIVVTRSAPTAAPRATVTFSGGGAAPRTRVFNFVSRSFHAVEFEFDSVQLVAPVTAYATGSHPDRPATLASELLTIERVYQRAGFAVTKSGKDSSIPITAAGPDAVWTDAEMHDAMQVHWSRFANKPQWALWVLFANRHITGPNLGGIMFDSIGPNHRQGTALFNNSFIATPPGGDTAPLAWVNRMKFWTAVHEMGHAFNLAHSWQKALGTPWIPLAADPTARSFMNYPFAPAVGGVPNFFKTFSFRFSDPELLFMRHAPERFVQMGNAAWFDHHGFEDGTSADPRFTLTVDIVREKPVFDFLEPVVVAVTLTNTSDEPQIVPANLLTDGQDLAVVVTKEGGPARIVAPFARYCSRGRNQVLEPGQSIHRRVFASAGTSGWHISEPGRYTVQVAVDLEGSRVVSEPARLRVRAPRGYSEEDLAMDFFTDDVARVIHFEGSLALTGATDTLREVVAQLPDHRASVHARLALAMPSTREYKVLSYRDTAAFDVIAPNAALVAEHFGPVLHGDRLRATTETLGYGSARALLGIGEEDVATPVTSGAVLEALLTERGVSPEQASAASARLR